jgi:hypothetical protein
MNDLQILAAVKSDCQHDAMTIDGKDFNGKNVGELVGSLLAAIVTLTGVLERHIKQQRMLHDGE